MRRTMLILTLVLVLVLVAVVPTFAHQAGPCEDSGEPGHSDYAQHHIVPLASEGNLGAPPSGHAHTPGSHQGYSACNPSGK